MIKPQTKSTATNFFPISVHQLSKALSIMSNLLIQVSPSPKKPSITAASVNIEFVGLKIYCCCLQRQISLFALPRSTEKGKHLFMKKRKNFHKQTTKSIYIYSSCDIKSYFNPIISKPSMKAIKNVFP
jgi:hypothetical protein